MKKEFAAITKIHMADAARGMFSARLAAQRWRSRAHAAQPHVDEPEHVIFKSPSPTFEQGRGARSFVGRSDAVNDSVTMLARAPRPPRQVAVPRGRAAARAPTAAAAAAAAAARQRELALAALASSGDDDNDEEEEEEEGESEGEGEREGESDEEDEGESSDGVDRDFRDVALLRALLGPLRRRHGGGSGGGGRKRSRRAPPSVRLRGDGDYSPVDVSMSATRQQHDAEPTSPRAAAAAEAAPPAQQRVFVEHPAPAATMAAAAASSAPALRRSGGDAARGPASPSTDAAPADSLPAAISKTTALAPLDGGAAAVPSARETRLLDEVQQLRQDNLAMRRRAEEANRVSTIEKQRLQMRVKELEMQRRTAPPSAAAAAAAAKPTVVAAPGVAYNSNGGSDGQSLANALRDRNDWRKQAESLGVEAATLRKRVREHEDTLKQTLADTAMASRKLRQALRSSLLTSQRNETLKLENQGLRKQLQELVRPTCARGGGRGVSERGAPSWFA